MPKATLYAWLSAERRLGHSAKPQKDPLIMTKRSKPRSPTVKLDLIAGSRGLHGDALVAYCNQNGMTVSELITWRDLALSGIELIYRDENGITRKEDSIEVINLKEDLRRKNEALAEAAALLILQKKTSEILGGLK